MSQNFVDAQDTLQIWDTLKNSVNARSAVNCVDYGFITPTILGDRDALVGFSLESNRS